MSPNIGNLLNGVLIPNLLNNPFASCLLINLDFSLQHTEHFDNMITLPLLVLETCGFKFSVCFYILNNFTFYTYVSLIK